MKLVVFEDSYYENLFPVAMTRPVFELKCGATSLLEKIERAAGARADAFYVRDYIAPSFARRIGKPVNDRSAVWKDWALFVNGRVLAMKTELPLEGEEEAVWDGDVLLYARAGAERLAHYGEIAHAGQITLLGKQLPHKEGKLPLVGYLWDLIRNNPSAVADDFEVAGKSGVEGKMASQSCIYGPDDRVYIAPGAEIHPFVCIDTNGGPVTIESGAEVHPFTRIEGPCYIGANSIILGAKVREGCSIGPVCRVGGEIEESIIHAYSNKYHDGFLGHAYVGEWVNLGALTTNSDLKNDYSTVSVMVKGELTDSGDTKVGAFIGDHVKTSIGTLFNTGAVVGTMAIVMAKGGVCPKYIPAFIWYLEGFMTKGFGFKALLATAKAAMNRRKVEMTPEEEELLKYCFDMTKAERTEYVKKDRKKMIVR